MTLYATIFLKALVDQVDQVWLRYQIFCFLNCLSSSVLSLQKWIVHFLLIRSDGEIIRIKHFFQSRKRRYLPYVWSDYCFKVTVVNWVLPSLLGGSLEIVLTVTLPQNFQKSHSVPLTKQSILQKNFFRFCYWALMLYIKAMFLYFMYFNLMPTFHLSKINLIYFYCGSNKTVEKEDDIVSI